MSAPEKAKLTLADLTPEMVAEKVSGYSWDLAVPASREQWMEDAECHLDAIRALLAEGGAK